MSSNVGMELASSRQCLSYLNSKGIGKDWYGIKVYDIVLYE